MKISRLTAVGLLAVTGVTWQGVLDAPKKIEDARTLLDSFRGDPLRCDVSALQPRFSFSLRLRSGYFWHLPLRESDLAGQKWIVLTEVTPKDGNRNPVYLSDVVQFPNRGDIAPEARAGHFWVGEGHYAVKFLMLNESGRACRAEWQIDARLSSNERKIAPLLAPNTVAGVSWSVAAHTGGTTPTNNSRLTILLNAAGEIRTMDQVLLMDALTALSDELQARSVRLVLFDLTQQRELFRQDRITPEVLAEAAKAIRAVQFEPMDLRALQRSGGAVDLIENLANLEIRSAEPADVVVFLGLPSLYKGKPSASFGQPQGAKPQFFYVICPPARFQRSYAPGFMEDLGLPVDFGIPQPVIGTAGPGAGDPARLPSGIPKPATHGPDSIEYAVRQLGGKIVKPDSPQSFAKAVAEITRQLGPNR